MINAEQNKLIVKLEHDMKKLGLTADYSHMLDDKYIDFSIDIVNGITIWIDNGCFLNLKLCEDKGFSKVASKAIDVANRFMKDYRKVSAEVPA